MKLKLGKTKPVIVLTFNQPMNGYWDGGMKSGGTFHPRLNSDGTIEWGCFGLNVWFRVKPGLTWKQAASFARRVIQHSCRWGCTTRIEWQAV